MIPPIAPLSSALSAAAPGAAGASTQGASGFAQVLGSVIDQIQSTQATANTQAQGVASGQASISNAMVASTESLLTTELAVQVRNGVVGAIDQVMSTQF
ncbi:flagellar hook-basal body complex protein FliE [Acidimicrobium ferrooxidans DSM 10331]|uniref:Flagellar hook-basal body complex protein FliE n=1 Tax=Acidimicrobium ferrooxidans (strain DSM 10331 / JCM 15462 / NBRC 103882 / ICP) TaxID=525909 RepID=C7M207_ACIFD|nr:flagellar hook-basal body complex protein FliE [Acidimicrobium ferrooxidans]ACU53105.1 flagellar hook-basal body complex protein FliE [Acidimicrobium ferrooxidans DSM 10331]